jgi:hypothetical protein
MLVKPAEFSMDWEATQFDPHLRESHAELHDSGQQEIEAVS